ncbi:MAG TPA: chemotaxis protein CheB [Burkholderiales bacterium]|nr:chemotaxis protein CheB [Burkholderiales bacterium]
MLSFDAIVIGASAGGVEAVSALLHALPSSCGAAVVVVIHVPPGNDNLLARVLAPRCTLPVREAADKEPVEAGNVYVAPPGYHLLIEPEKTFALSLDEPVHYSRPSLDVLFESAAHAYRERLLGIVLTGANADGAEGLRIVRELGGTGWVQQPETAYAQAMPAAAIARAGADRVATVAEIAQALGALHGAATTN